MAQSFAWGVLAASPLVIGAILALRVRFELQTIGLIMGFGAGALISAVAFDLVDEAVHKSSGHGATLAGLFIGCGAFFGGDWAIDRMGGSKRKSPRGAEDGDDALGIVLGSVLDGIPESIVVGLTIYESGAVGGAYLAALLMSNLPEAISSTVGLVAAGWRRRTILAMWSLIVAVSGVASLAGYVAFQHAPDDVVAFVLTFAAGAT